MTSVKTNISKFMVMLAMAMVASLFCVGNAFASVYVDVTIPVPGTSTTDTVQVQLDKSGVQNADAYHPVVGMFYKNNAWNVVLTGTAVGQYASWDSILAEAVAVHNAKPAYASNQTTVEAVNAAATQQKLSLTASDGTYTKYYPQGADLDGSANGRGYFYDLATNANTTLLSTLRSSSYTLTSTVNGTNPNGAGPVFAWQYAAGVTGANETAGDTADEIAEDVVDETPQAQPRLIMGCSDGMTNNDAMGKRYCTGVTAIALS